MSRLEYLESKIVSMENAKRLIAMWHLKSDKVVFTNGCFDILHKGHVTYLAKAAELGKRLIVAINTDKSVKQQGKGEEKTKRTKRETKNTIPWLHLPGEMLLAICVLNPQREVTSHADPDHL